MVIYGSNMGQVNIHDNTNRPLILASGFKHSQHIAFKSDSNAPLCNLFVSGLRRMGGGCIWQQYRQHRRTELNLIHARPSHSSFHLSSGFCAALTENAIRAIPDNKITL